MEIKIAREGERQERYKKNLGYLVPGFRERIEALDETEVWEKIEISWNPEGYPVCRYHDEGRSFLINSEHPREEAEQWCRNITVKGAGGIFLFGAGFGYPLFELFEKKQPHTVVILFEQNLYLLKAMLFYFDLEPLFRTGRLILLAGDIEDFSGVFDELFFSIVFVSCTSPVLAFTHAANRNFKSVYQKINHFIFSRLALFVFYIGNDHYDNLVGLFNLLANSRTILENPSIECLREQYKGIPAFIVANGPSLDKNIDELHRIKGRGLILCAESAILPLLKNKIKPDILTIIERTKYTYLYHFKDVSYPSDMALICLGLVDKRVFPSFRGEKIPVFRNAEAINQWINGYLGDGNAIDAGANVSHLAFELAVLMGADPIVFVGQDYAYGADGVTHSRGAVYNEEKGRKSKEQLQAMPTVSVEGNDGSMIPSTKLWKDFRIGLERKIAAHPEKTIINATEGGAKIHGTVCRALSEVIDDFCDAPLPYPVHRLIAEKRVLMNRSEKKGDLIRLIQSVDAYLKMFCDLAQLANKGKLECCEMIRIAEKADEGSRQVLESAYLKNMQLFERFIDDTLCRSFCQQVVFSSYYQMNHLGFIDTGEKMIEIFGIHHDFFQNLFVVCQSVAVHFEDARESLKKIEEEYESETTGG
ncbi:MAG: hypothetical protein K0Q48_3300 [Bacillota bacterium]|jgi:hypothetical protein|nr:hypothetical protein [Bacillota bacterium]